MTNIEPIRWRLRRFRPLVRRPIVWYRHRNLRPSDIVLAEHPKSGSTWLAFMVAEAVFGSPVDFENQRSFVPGVGERALTATIPSSDGRLLRSHEKYRPEYRRGIYLVRHCADVALSYYHWLRWKGIADVDFKRLLRDLLLGRLDGYGGWPAHVRSWLDAEHADVLVIRYEDLRESPRARLSEVVKHLGCQVSEQAIQSAIEKNTLERMREKEVRTQVAAFKSRTSGGFVRSGRIGESRSLLDDSDLAFMERVAGDVFERMGYSIPPKRTTGTGSLEEEASRERGGTDFPDEVSS